MEDMEVHQSLEHLLLHYSCNPYPIGSGASAQVYHGNLPDGRQIALKVLNPDANESEFLNSEVLWLPQLQNPHIIQLLRYGSCETTCRRLFLAYEFMDGGSLLSRLEAPAALEWHHIISVIRGIAAGIDNIHSFGLVHGDIKIANILVTQDLQTKIGDFGTIAVEGSRPNGGAVLHLDPHAASIRKYQDIMSLGYVILQAVMLKPVTSPFRMIELAREAKKAMKKGRHIVHRQFMEHGCTKLEARGITKVALACINKGVEKSAQICEMLERIGQPEENIFKRLFNRLK